MNRRAFHRAASTAAPELRADLGLSLSIDSPVLISGDPARARRIALAVHQKSSRSQGPFVAVSCASTETSFAKKAEVDLLAAGRLASGGTLFIEHVDHTTTSLQRELMLVLEMTSEPVTHANRGVGGARVIVAASGDLYSKVIDGEFREDLFYRLNVIHLHLPVEHDATDSLGAPPALPPPSISVDEAPVASVEASSASREGSETVAAAMDDAGMDFESEDDPAVRARMNVRAREDSSKIAPNAELTAAKATDRDERESMVRRARVHLAAEAAALRRQAVVLPKRFAALVASRQQLLRPSARSLPLLTFVCGMVAGGSLVVMGNVEAERAGTPPVALSSDHLVSATELQPLPDPPTVQPGGAAWSGGTYRSSLRVESRPSGAHVYLNNEDVGVTPLDLGGLAVGSRAVRIELPGYEKWTSAVTVTTEHRARVAADLRPLPNGAALQRAVTPDPSPVDQASVTK